jgi:hypothetical protein
MVKNLCSTTHGCYFCIRQVENLINLAWKKCGSYHLRDEVVSCHKREKTRYHDYMWYGCHVICVMSFFWYWSCFKTPPNLLIMDWSNPLRKPPRKKQTRWWKDGGGVHQCWLYWCQRNHSLHVYNRFEIFTRKQRPQSHHELRFSIKSKSKPTTDSQKP